MEWPARGAWASYVPDVLDNRARAARGEPHLTVQIRPPSSGVWRAFMFQVLSRHAALVREHGSAAAILTALLDDGCTAPLWLGCVGTIEGLVYAGVPVTDGAEAWAKRQDIDREGDIFTEVLLQLVPLASLTGETSRFLRSSPGSTASPPATGAPGTAPSAVPSDSIAPGTATGHGTTTS
jgi:hypothetical protein